MPKILKPGEELSRKISFRVTDEQGSWIDKQAEKKHGHLAKLFRLPAFLRELVESAKRKEK